MTDTDPFEDPDVIIIDTDLLDLPPIQTPAKALPASRLSNGPSAKEMRKAKIAERKRKRNNRPPRFINSRQKRT